ncbi:MAG: amino acid ABC transporter ATP-binding protein [Christensenellales bacterium]|jgi:ABC-type polar amino acid transport system ATPase subunit|nr:amino acid ABC transporter ATP-binding protein [Clostridiales bacterium]
MILEVKNMHKCFGKVEALKGPSFSMNKGEVLVIIGPSGSGKSTLLRCLCFLERMEKGSITIKGDTFVKMDENGNSIYPDEKTLREKALHFGLVFQNFNLFPHLNVLENLTLAPILVDKLSKEEAEEKAMKLLERVGLIQKAKNYPFELSGGQQQRVAIARALSMEPDILCFDEPTSALDPELTGEVLKVIRELKRQIHSTMIIVTHEMNFAKSIADKVIFMDEGEIIEEGTPDRVFNLTENPRIKAFLSKILGDE